MSGKSRIAFASLPDATSKSTWSGTPYFMAHALAEHFEQVFHVSPMLKRLEMMGGVADKAILKLTRKRCVHKRTHFFSKKYAESVTKQIKHSGAEMVFAISSTVIAHMNIGKIPIIYSSDTTFASIYDYYPGFENYATPCLKQAHQVEKMALERANLIIYPSQWAADSAIRDYGVSEEKICVVPYGANIDSWPEIEFPKRNPGSKECNLLFLGVDWNRKGGEIALQALVELEERYGLLATLYVVGCRPPVGVNHERMKVIGFLDKRDKQQYGRFLELLMKSHYLFLPTRAECYGLVFCEASAYGMPSISTDTGGVGGVVRNGENGYLLPIDAGPEAYAKRIHDIETKPGSYEKLSESSRQYFEENLNWHVWGERVSRIISRLADG